jgi:N-acyl-D-amino-acid deacylase
LFVTPGFINIHSHATPDGLMTAANMLTRGVTTEILNADGSGPIDLNDQLARATARGLAVNVGANIGFNSVWSHVVGLADRRNSGSCRPREAGPASQAGPGCGRLNLSDP